MKKFREWGLSNVHQERWAFGKGWSLVRFTAHMVEPQIQPLTGFPQEWSSGTKGPVTADVVRVQIASEADLARYHGKLAGKIVLPQSARRVRMLEGPVILRMTERDIAEAETTPVPTSPGGGGRGGAAAVFRQKVNDFYVQEGVVAVFDRGSDGDMAAGGSDLSWQQQHPDGGTIFPNGASPRDDKAGKSVPVIALAVEHYNRMIRVLDKNVPVKVELNVETKFYDESEPNGFNTIADIPGTDLASEIVLLGAHFDSHPYATGATDNATGSGAMMEAVRILKAVGAKPRQRSASGCGAGRAGAARLSCLRPRTCRRRRHDGAETSTRSCRRCSTRTTAAERFAASGSRAIWLCGRSSRRGWRRFTIWASRPSARGRSCQRITCRSTTPASRRSSSWSIGSSTTRARIIRRWTRSIASSETTWCSRRR